jgi:predicted LPLAT superfamily acyltransferase
VIPADGSQDASLAIIGALTRGEVVAMQADRCLETQEELIPFLGTPARFPKGPFVAAAVAGAPLIHAFAVREGTYRYRLRAYPPEHVAFGDRRERPQLLREWMGRFVQHLEETLREHPLQWHNFYDFWERKEKA